MICPKCGSNNPKDPLQCIRCGYIFPEYISKHNIDMNRKGVDKKEIKRVEAVRNFTPKSQNKPHISVKNVSRMPIEGATQIKKEVPTQPVSTKIKKVIYMGRNGVNRFDDIKECFIVSLIYVAILLAAGFIYTNIL